MPRWIFCVALVACAHAAESPSSSSAPPPAPTPTAAVTAGVGLSESQMELIFRDHKHDLTTVCWNGTRDGGAQTASERVHLVIGPTGHVTSVSADGDDAAVSACLTREIGLWKFPASGGATTVEVPFKFVSQ